jgi:hypothetical protein
MDPYLERPSWWPGIHNRLIAVLADALEPLLPAGYYVSTEERTYISMPGDAVRVGRPELPLVETTSALPAGRAGAATLDPGVEVLLPAPEPLRENYLEIRSTEEPEALITVIELLSPDDKRPGDGRDQYLEKRGAVLASRTNLLEIDLLRAGHRMPDYGEASSAAYRLLISRGADRPRAVLYPFGIRDPLPPLPVPLRPGEAEPIVDLGLVLAHVYARGRFGQRIDYRRPPVPLLSPDDEGWADAWLREPDLR